MISVAHPAHEKTSLKFPAISGSGDLASSDFCALVSHLKRTAAQIKKQKAIKGISNGMLKTSSPFWAKFFVDRWSHLRLSAESPPKELEP